MKLTPNILMMKEEIEQREKYSIVYMNSLL